MRSEAIAEIGVDESGRVFVCPVSGSFEFVYRAGMEIYWNESTRRLSHPAPKEWSSVRWYRQIIDAVSGEYGVQLDLTNETVWSNVRPEVRAEIIAQAK